MPFTESEIAEHTALIEELFWSRRRPPLHLREKIREGQRLEGLNIELFFARPSIFRPEQIIEEDIARIQWMRTRKIWKLYWKRADLKWHRYDPLPEAANLAEALRVIDEDAFRCFLG
jgi:hypothetical protein